MVIKESVHGRGILGIDDRNAVTVEAPRPRGSRADHLARIALLEIMERIEAGDTGDAGDEQREAGAKHGGIMGN